MMNNNIHPTAIIGDSVILGQNNTIGPYVVIEGNIVIGNDNYIGAFTRIINNVEIENSNRFDGYVTIGSLGEMGAKGDVFVEDGKVIIGSNNTFREFININSPVRRKTTKIGNKCYFMARTYLPHDVHFGDNVTMATNAVVGGGCIVEDYVYLGLNSAVHQWTDLGESCMIGLQAAVTKPIPPFCIVTGVPARILKLNEVGLQRRGFDSAVIEEAKASLKSALNSSYNGENAILQKISAFILKYPESLVK